jgi:hypothetical protein
MCCSSTAPGHGCSDCSNVNTVESRLLGHDRSASAHTEPSKLARSITSEAQFTSTTPAPPATMHTCMQFVQLLVLTQATWCMHAGGCPPAARAHMYTIPDPASVCTLNPETGAAEATGLGHRSAAYEVRAEATRYPPVLLLAVLVVHLPCALQPAAAGLCHTRSVGKLSGLLEYGVLRC